MKNIVIAVAVALVVWIGYSNFHKSNPVSTSQESIKVGIAIYPGFGTFYIAQDKEFFKKEGVNVEIVPLSLDAMLPALASDQVQMLVGSTDMLSIVADAGIPAKQIFSTSMSYGADGIVVKDNIQNISDLKGRQVYTAYGFPGHFFLRSLANKAGLSYTDIELINLDPDQVGASFVAGKIDAGVTWEPWLSNARVRKDGSVLVTSSDEPGLITDVVIARNDLVEKQRGGVLKLMRAFFAAETWWENNVTDGNAIVAKNFHLTADEFAPMKDTVKLSDLETNLQKFDKSTPLNVYALVEEAVDIYFNDGVIKIKASGDAVTDPSLLDDLR